MTARRPVRAAIVGAGLMGRWHARAVEHAGGVVAAVVDADPGRAARLSAAHGCRTAATLSEAAARDAIDVVHICTPLGTHVPLTREAIALGVHALVEKPLAETASSTEALLGEASAKAVLICPVHQFPFQRGTRDIIAALPRIGPVVHVSATACSAGADGGDAHLRDHVADDILPHPFSLFSTILDASIANSDWTVRRPAPGELLATGQAGAVTLSLHISMSGRPTTNQLTVVGARGTAHADLFHGFAVVESGDVSRASKILHPFALSTATLARSAVNLAQRAIAGDAAYPGLRELIAAFHAAIRGGKAPISIERILDVARARDIVLKKKGPPVGGPVGVSTH